MGYKVKDTLAYELKVYLRLLYSNICVYAKTKLDVCFKLAFHKKC